MAKSKSSAPVFKTDLLKLLQTRTQKEAARLLGVNERTIRRWKNEGATPKIERQQKIVQTYKQEQRVKRETKKLKLTPKISRIIGGSVFYDVRGWSDWAIAKLLKYLHDKAPEGYPPLVRFIIRVPRGGQSPGGREYKQGGFYSSQIISMEHAEGDTDYLETVIDNNHQKLRNEIHEVVQVLPWVKGK